MSEGKCGGREEKERSTTAEGSAQCSHDAWRWTPLDGLKLLLKIRLFQAKGLEVGKVEGETLPRRFPQEARHDVVHTNVDTKKQADLRHICKLSALSVEKTEVSITAPTFYANSYLRALLRRC